MEKLRKQYPDDKGKHYPNDKEVFDATRHIVIALMQKVVYGEWLPVILGKEFVQNPSNNLDLPIKGTTYDPKVNPSIENGFATAAFRFGHSMIQGKTELRNPKNKLDLPIKGTTYDRNVNPSIENGFATAAFRFGHSMIQGLIEIKDHRTNEIEREKVSENLFNDENYLATNGVDNIIYGLTQQPAELMDAKVTPELTNFLFKEKGSDHGGDLVARNIQRGRDHGLGSYLAYRAEFSGKKENVRTHCDEPDGIKREDWKLVMELYKDPEDVDLFTGGLLENAVSGSILGATFHGMIGEYISILL